MIDDDPELLKGKLLGETARVTWPEIERLFASGLLVRVSSELDLIEVGEAMAADDAGRIRHWMQRGEAGLLDDATAQRWAQDAGCDLWAVVIRPWVLVQERAARR